METRNKLIRFLFDKFSAPAFAALFTTGVASMTSILSYCTSLFCNTAVLAFIFFVSWIVFAFFIGWAIDGYKWVRYRSDIRNVRVFPTKFEDNAINLKVSNLEWRRPFATIHRIDVEYRDGLLDEQETHERLMLKLERFPLKRFQSNEIQFIKVDSDGQMYFTNLQGQKVEIGFGIHVYRICIIVGFETSNDSVLRYSVKVEYREKGKITMNVVEHDLKQTKR